MTLPGEMCLHLIVRDVTLTNVWNRIVARVLSALQIPPVLLKWVLWLLYICDHHDFSLSHLQAIIAANEFTQSLDILIACFYNTQKQALSIPN